MVGLKKITKKSTNFYNFLKKKLEYSSSFNLSYHFFPISHQRLFNSKPSLNSYPCYDCIHLHFELASCLKLLLLLIRNRAASSTAPSTPSTASIPSSSSAATSPSPLILEFVVSTGGGVALALPLTSHASQVENMLQHLLLVESGDFLAAHTGHTLHILLQDHPLLVLGKVGGRLLVLLAGHPVPYILGLLVWVHAAMGVARKGIDGFHLSSVLVVVAL